MAILHFREEMCIPNKTLTQKCPNFHVTDIFKSLYHLQSKSGKLLVYSFLKYTQTKGKSNLHIWD